MIEKKEFEVAKELGEVLDLVKEVVKVIKEKGDYSSLMSDLVVAVTGMGDIPEEIKNKKAVAITVTDKSFDIVEIFTKKEA